MQKLVRSFCVSRKKETTSILGCLFRFPIGNFFPTYVVPPQKPLTSRLEILSYRVALTDKSQPRDVPFPSTSNLGQTLLSNNQSRWCGDCVQNSASSSVVGCVCFLELVTAGKKLLRTLRFLPVVFCERNTIQSYRRPVSLALHSFGRT